MGKILTFIGGCLAGVIGVFTVAAMSEISTEKRSEENDNLPTVSDEEGILK